MVRISVFILFLISVFIFALFPSITNTQPRPLNSHSCEIAVILDGSESIIKHNPAYFELQLEKVKQLANNLIMSEQHTRVAVVQIGEFPTIDQQLTGDETVLKQLELKNNKKPSWLHMALNLAKEKVFKSARIGAKKIIVVMTDGNTMHKRLSKIAAKELRKGGVETFVIFMGKIDDAGKKHIEFDLAGDSRRAFHIGEFDKLVDLLPCQPKNTSTSTAAMSLSSTPSIQSTSSNNIDNEDTRASSQTNQFDAEAIKLITDLAMYFSIAIAISIPIAVTVINLGNSQKVTTSEDMASHEDVVDTSSNAISVKMADQKYKAEDKDGSVEKAKFKNRQDKSRLVDGEESDTIVE